MTSTEMMEMQEKIHRIVPSHASLMTRKKVTLKDSATEGTFTRKQRLTKRTQIMNHKTTRAQPPNSSSL